MTDQTSGASTSDASADQEALSRLFARSAKRAPDPDIKLIESLLDAADAGRIQIDIGRKLIVHPHSPLSVAPIETQAVFAVALPPFAVWYFAGWDFALASFLVLAAIYWFVGRHWMNRLMRNKALKYIRQNPDSWGKSWAFGGMVLMSPDGSAPCVAPDGSWREFARKFVSAPQG